MLEISIPGFGDLCLEHLVLDYNGTLACDGEIIAGVAEALNRLADELRIHVLTADTFGKARAGVEGLPGELEILARDDQDVGKLDYVNRLGAERAVCIGNGRNDWLMVKAAALGIALIQEEGAASETLAAADVVCPRRHRPCCLRQSHERPSESSRLTGSRRGRGDLEDTRWHATGLRTPNQLGQRERPAPGRDRLSLRG